MPNTRHLRVAVAPLAIVLALALAACGGGGSSSSSNETIAFADWSTQADKVCSDANTKLQSDLTDFFGNQTTTPSADQMKKFSSDVLVPSFETLISDLRDLPTPDKNADKVDQMISSLEDGIGELKDNPELITSANGPKGIQDATKVAKDLGLKSCGQ